MRDGFFHADMHQGEPTGRSSRAASSRSTSGIMGRLGFKERRFLAEILHGLITRDYHRTAAIHFEAGYVPSHQSVELFRAGDARRSASDPRSHCGRDLHGLAAVGQLFAYTEVFDMRMRRSLLQDHGGGGGGCALADPELNI